MTDKRTIQNSASGNAQKDPDDWVTGDEPMTDAQRSYLKTLSEEAKLPFDDALTKAQASQRIEELQRITGRGAPSSNDRPAERSIADDDPPGSSTGEEDPDAGIDDPATRDALEAEARSVGAPGAAHAASTIDPRREEK
jgi:hypothetical protein